jgi:hypothetical protein
MRTSLTALLLLGAGTTAAAEPVTSGPGADYQPAILRAADGALLLCFERLDAQFSGDLWLTRSADGGQSWSMPAPVVNSSANERHASLLQLGNGSFVLYYLKGTGATSSFRLMRATSTAGVAFTEQGALALGWATGGEVNPHAIVHPDGQTVTLTYHRLGGGASYIAQSTDGGTTFDTLRTALSSGASQLPRIAYRPADGRYLAVWQVGSSNLQLFARTTTNVLDWSATATPLTADGDNHDPLPFVLADGGFGVLNIRADGSQYDIVVRRSTDGVVFSPPQPLVTSADANDVQPHALPDATGSGYQLYWGREAPPGSTAYRIWRMGGLSLPAPDALLANGFEG